MKHIKKFLTPHIYTNRITDINFQYLQDNLGIKILLIDKDDTLTCHHVEQLHPSLCTKKLNKISKLFQDNVYIVSNSRREWEINWGDLNLHEDIKKNNSFQKIITNWKKPLNSEQLTQILQEKSNILVKWNEICVIGDRILTDVLLGKINDSFTIQVKDFEESEISYDIKMLRKLESQLAQKKNFQKLNFDMYNDIKIDEEKLFYQIIEIY